MKLKAMPPLASLRPFEAAARRRSFTAAADELCVTQAAISKQVRLLERDLGLALFVRKGRAVELTQEGEELQRAIAHGLSHIADTASSIRGGREKRRLSIAMRAPFAQAFMVPRMAALQAAAPEFEFNIIASERDPASLIHSVDLAIALGWEPQPQFVAERLFSEEIFPVCAPAYAEARADLKTAEDLADQRLIHLAPGHWRDLAWDPIDWPALARALGAAREPPSAGAWFSSHDLVMGAALAGLGVAVAWRHLCLDHLTAGRLVRPIEGALRLDRGHYVVAHAADAERPAIAALRRWFIDETAPFRAT